MTDASDKEAPSPCARICSVTVTFQPELDVLSRQLAQLPEGCLRVVVDNASAPELVEGLRKLLEPFGAILVCNASNRGLAAAQNQGADIAAARLGTEGVLLFLDQDTEPGEGAVEALLAAYLRAAAKIGPGAAGPRMLDVATGMDHGFHVMRGLRWCRVHPGPSEEAPVECANLNASGTLVPTSVFRASGGMDESLFIDHVDTDWAFRMRARGFHLFGIPGVSFAHRMGEASQRVWLFGWRVWPKRSPLRHYYLFRNAVRLMRRDYVPRVWKAWAAAKLGMTVVMTLLVDARRREQAKQMVRGLVAGVRDRD